MLVIGDVHFRGKKLKDISSAWSAAVDWAHKDGIDLIVQCGDVFDHANVYSREWSTGSIYSEFLQPFIIHEKPIPLFVIPGNHDMGSPKDKDALSPVDRYPWITVVRKPAVVQVNNKLSICAVPWINRVHLVSKLLAGGMELADATKKVESAIAQLMLPLGEQVSKEHDSGRFVLFIGHLEVAGAKLTGATQHGGAFEFSSGSLRAVGADAYALAHIHIRQHIDGLPNPNDGYLGCLCQLNFGEQDNKVGCRLLEIDGRQIIEDRWLDNKSSPRYFTASSIDGLQYRQGVDYVKIRALSKPETLPEGIIFERLPQAIHTRTRTEEKLDCDLSLAKLLAAWRSITNCQLDVDILTKEAERLLGQTQVQTESIGSLERITELKVKNLTCHSSTEINLDINGIVGVAGPNGTGKTTAIEAIMLALYGVSPSRPALQSLMPKGDSIDAAVELKFRSGGQQYIARREFNKTKKSFSHKAFLFQEGDSKPLASSVDGVFSFNSTLVGDCDLVLAGVFSSQGDAGNLVKLKPAARKDLFAKLLGTEKFLGISEAAKKTYAADHASILAEKARIDALKTELVLEGDDQNSLTSSTASMASKQSEADSIQTQIDAISACMSEMEGSKKEAENARRTLVDLERRKQKTKEEGIALKQQRKEIEGLSAADISTELERAKKARDEAQVITDQMEKMQQQILEAEREFNKIKDSRTAEFVELSEKLRRGQNKLETLQSKLGEAKRRAGLLKGFPDVDICRTCPLAKDSLESRDGMDILEKEIDVINVKLISGEGVVAAHGEATAILLAEAKTNIQKIPPDMISKRADLLKQAAIIPELEAKHAKTLSAKAEIAKLDALLEAARKGYADIEGQIAIHHVPEFDEQAWTKLAAERTTMQATLKKMHSEISACSMDIGKYKAKLEQHAARKTELASLTEDIGKKEGQAAIYEALAKAFGRDGIPQLIVDSAIPHLQEIMFDMLSEIDGKWSIRMATQRETKSGSTQERIDIIVDDGEDERDISTYSGGEMNLLATIVRIAFSILQAERSGKGLKVLVLDECMYFADNEYSDAFMRMLKKLPKYFNQIFVISHSEFVLASIQNKIFFARGSDGRTIVKTDYGVIR